MKTLTKPQMSMVLGGISECTPGGQDGIKPPYRKYTSDCVEKNSKGQIYYAEYFAADGTRWEWFADPWVPRT